MALQAAPAYIAKQADGVTDFQHPVELMRNLLAAQCGKRSGAFRYGDFNVTTTGSGMGINIAAGSGYLNGVESNTQGGYFAWSNASEVQTFGAASGSTRYDTVLLRVADNQYGTISGAPRAYWSLVPGAAGAGAPRADSYFNTGGGSYNPGAWLRVADVRIDPGDVTINSGKIVMAGNYIAPPGGRILCLSTARPASPLLGDVIFEIDTTLEYIWNGSNWRLAGPYKRFSQLTGTTASVTWSGIPSTLRVLRITMTARGDSASAFVGIGLQVNGSASAAYKYQSTFSQNGGAVGAAAPQTGQTSALIGYATAATTAGGVFGASEAVIAGWDNPASHTSYLTYKANGGYLDTAANSLNTFQIGAAGVAGPYTSVTLVPLAGNFVAGSQFVLEGWD